MNKLSYLRAEAKKNGLTFKAVDVNLNGKQAYSLFNRKTGEKVGSLTTIIFAYDQQKLENYFSEYKAV